MTISNDPVRARRARVQKWTLIANRVGYLLMALCIALFVMAFAFSFNPTMATLITGLFFASCALLAPSIVLKYAVREADREDEARGL